MRTFSVREMVDVTLDGRGLPAEFFWRKNRYRVQRVQRFSKPGVNRGTGRNNGCEYQLQTDRGLKCVLRMEVPHGIWTLVTVLNGRGS